MTWKGVYGLLHSLGRWYLWRWHPHEWKNPRFHRRTYSRASHSFLPTSLLSAYCCHIFRVWIHPHPHDLKKTYLIKSRHSFSITVWSHLDSDLPTVLLVLLVIDKGQHGLSSFDALYILTPFYHTFRNFFPKTVFGSKVVLLYI